MIKSLADGMSTEVSFVRYHFISFVVQILPTMSVICNSKDFTKTIDDFIGVFTRLLKQVDVTLYGKLTKQDAEDDNQRRVIPQLVKRATIRVTTIDKQSLDPIP